MQVIPYIEKIAEQKIKDITIYPNPVNHTLIIDATDEIINIQIYNMQGMVISESDYTTSIDVSNLPYSIYQIVCIFNDGSRLVKSFVKS